MKTMHMTELKDVYQNLSEGEVVLDCRTAEEFQEGHLEGAINISHESLKDHVDELRKYKKIYLHCRSGGRVQMALLDLSGTGLNESIVAVTSSGMLDWLKAGLPVVK